jgi:monovalent cation/proton antiporter MnhG/PhaG subunit
MSAATHVLLVVGVTCQAICCVGVVAMRDTFDRLHFAGAATTLGPVLVAASLVVRRSLTAPGFETIATAAILCLAGPALLIATARAARETSETDEEEGRR